MVVDDMDVSGEEQRRRYLVYDCMMMAGEGISDLRFQVESRAATSTMQPVLHAHACKGLVPRVPYGLSGCVPCTCTNTFPHYAWLYRIATA
jgi:hypothetical protein